MQKSRKQKPEEPEWKRYLDKRYFLAVGALFLIWFFTLGPMGANARARRAEEHRLSLLPAQTEALTLGRQVVDASHAYAKANGGQMPTGLDQLASTLQADAAQRAREVVEWKCEIANTADMVGSDLIAMVKSSDGYILVFFDRSIETYLFYRTREGAKLWNPETKSFRLLRSVWKLDRMGNPIGDKPIIR